jgi:hypothetical protein
MEDLFSFLGRNNKLLSPRGRDSSDPQNQFLNDVISELSLERKERKNVLIFSENFEMLDLRNTCT